MKNLLLKGFNTLGFAIPLISELFMFIDHLIYWVANLSMQLFFQLEEISSNIAVNAPEIGYIMDRIMILAGVFALFRLSLMIINYLIHPEKVSELQKTSTSIITNLIIAVILLASSKFIFEQLGNFQHLIFENQLIPKLVYGADNATEANTFQSEDATGRFVNNVWLLFYTPKNGTGCVNDNSGSCQAYNRVKSGEYGSILALAGTQYTDFDYLPVISGVVGIILIYYFIRFSIELGVRIVELFTLQVISPIPIIMSVDPSRKNQLSTFAKTYLSVYAQIFLRVLTFYLAFVVIDILQAFPDSLNGTANIMLLRTDINAFVKVILIIAVFQAASKLPKLIENALGVKLGMDTGGKGFAGAVKTILGGTAGFLGGAVAGGLAGGIGGAVVGAGSGLVGGAAAMGTNANIGKGISATVASIGKARQAGKSVADVQGLRNFAIGKFDNLTGQNRRIDEQASTAKIKVDAYDAFETAVYSDYAKATDPTTGTKYGTMEDDIGVITAKGAYNKFLKDYQEGTAIDPSTGALFTPAAAGTQLTSLKRGIDTAEGAYKQRAFNWFENGDATTPGSINRATGTVNYDPKRYTSLSESQRAHYELTRIDKKPLVTPTTAPAGTTFYSTFDAAKKNAKTTLKVSEDQKKAPRYRNAQEVGKKK